MASVTINTGDLAVALRIIADSTETPDSGVESILTRNLATATAIVERYAPDAPAAILDEAATRVAGFLFDRPPEAASRGISALLHSGAQSVLSPWRNPGLGQIGDVVDPSSDVHAAYHRVALLAAQTFLRPVSAENSALLLDPLDTSLTPGPDDLGEIVSDAAGLTWLRIPTIPPAGVNCVIVDAADTAGAEPFATAALPWINTWGRLVFVFAEETEISGAYLFASARPDTKTRIGLVLQAGEGVIPQGLTLRWHYGAL